MKHITKFWLAATALLAPLAAHAADINAPYLPPPPAAAAPPPACYAVFFMYRDGKGPSLVREGPEDVPVIRALSYADGRSLNRRVLSVTTSPGAVVELFNGRRYRRPMLEVGPESTVNLARPVADSYRLHCVAPPPPPAPPPFK
jgi:hypothetical protein